jgi:purine nucleosidase
MSKVPVILDTDIGSDIDDAVCLAYLLRQPKCELLGVTTVSGKVLERAALADAVCRAAGRRDIPIHAGCSHASITARRRSSKPGLRSNFYAIRSMRARARSRCLRSDR